ncbi:Dil domain-containing protein [Artemisia annua]|uniref:Dil domain-containing protein n=1 Tax=Artemisia annua TaxID=35608 RepID=A0A2U1NT58_ARTAN|nr:Dil domain-containing protein [Artemisia annua]
MSIGIYLMRLEEKLSNIESENQVLSQQAMTVSPNGKSLSARPRTMIIQRTPKKWEYAQWRSKGGYTYHVY